MRIPGFLRQFAGYCVVLTVGGVLMTATLLPSVRQSDLLVPGVILFFTAAAFFCLQALRAAERRIGHAAHHDALAGIPNRQFLLERLRAAILEAAGEKQSALHYLDLDHFKRVNDMMGHHAGDETIKIVADRLRSCLQPGDFVARIGGDEFAIVQEDCSKREQASALAARIIECLRKPFVLDGRSVNIETSIGIAVVTGLEADAHVLLRRADLALSDVKSSGRGRYAFYAAEMDEKQKRRNALKNDLAAALANDQFFLCYQPIVCVRTEATCGVEALLNWRHPKRGLIPPGEFIPLAEETGHSNAIGEWVLKRACCDIARLPGDLRLAINVSAAQIRQPSLGLHLVTALNMSGLKPERLEFEITDSAVLSGDRQSVEMLAELRRMGASIALDHFGSDYSSLGCLKTFPFDRIKIDRSLVMDAGISEGAAILRAIAGLATSLGIATTAEGIETESQLKLMRQLGCSEAQGFYFDRPLEFGDLQRRLAPRRAERA